MVQHTLKKYTLSFSYYNILIFLIIIAMFIYNQNVIQIINIAMVTLDKSYSCLIFVFKNRETNSFLFDVGTLFVP